MLFTIVVPVYNVERYLPNCIDSILNQTNKDYEIILVNDGSTDNSLSICERYEKANSRQIRILNQQNSGLLAARRAGFKEAKGEYILSLDSDDCFRMDTLQIVAEEVKRTNADVIEFADSSFPDYSEYHYAPAYPERRHFSKNDYKEILKKFCSTRQFSTMAFKAIRAEVLNAENDYSDYRGLNHYEDQLQSSEVLDRAKTFTYIPERLYFYRMRKSSLNHRYSQRYLDDTVRVFDKRIHYAKEWQKKYNLSGLVDGTYARFLVTMYSSVPYILNLKSDETSKSMLKNVSYNEMLCTALTRGNGLTARHIYKYCRILNSGNWTSIAIAGSIVCLSRKLKPTPKQSCPIYE